MVYVETKKFTDATILGFGHSWLWPFLAGHSWLLAIFVVDDLSAETLLFLFLGQLMFQLQHFLTTALTIYGKHCQRNFDSRFVHSFAIPLTVFLLFQPRRPIMIFAYDESLLAHFFWLRATTPPAAKRLGNVLRSTRAISVMAFFPSQSASFV